MVDALSLLLFGKPNYHNHFKVIFPNDVLCLVKYFKCVCVCVYVVCGFVQHFNCPAIFVKTYFAKMFTLTFIDSFTVSLSLINIV